jgi:hypothetical protein
LSFSTSVPSCCGNVDVDADVERHPLVGGPGTLTDPESTADQLDVSLRVGGCFIHFQSERKRERFSDAAKRQSAHGLVGVCAFSMDGAGLELRRRKLRDVEPILARQRRVARLSFVVALAMSIDTAIWEVSR